MAIEIRPFTAEHDVLTGRSDVVWLLPALVASGFVYAVYLMTHPYPAFGAGLYFLVAEQVSQHGYRLPAVIPYYTDPIPFAYPPLMFYVLALLRDLTGLDPITISRVLPGLVTTAYLVPFYLFVRELVGSKRQASVAAFVLALSPPVLEWHLSAGGIVRAPAALFLITGLYTGLMLFRTKGPKWVVASTVAFGFTVLTHPTYALFFVLSYLWMYLSLDRTVRGLRYGTLVGVGGLILTVPWWGQVVAAHGPTVFTGAAGTHGGIASRLPELAVAFVPDLVWDVSPRLLTETRSAELFSVRPRMLDLGAAGLLLLFAWLGFILGAAASLVTVDELRSSGTTVFLLGWLFLSLVVVSQPRFLFMVGAVVTPVAIYTYLIPLSDRFDAVTVERRSIELGVLLVLGISCLSVGGLYAASQLDSHAGSPSLPAFIDDDDVAAMEWVAANTSPSDTFVVLGDGAEWFPTFTHRGILVGPWGVEWKGSDSYDRQLGQFIELSTCSSEDCLTRELDQAGVQPDYLYLPKGEYTVRGVETTTSPELRTDLVRSSDYTLVYENDGAMIFRVHDSPPDVQDTSAEEVGERDRTVGEPISENGESVSAIRARHDSREEAIAPAEAANQPIGNLADVAPFRSTTRARPFG